MLFTRRGEKVVGVGAASMGVAGTGAAAAAAVSRPNSTVGGVSVLEEWAGDSPAARLCPLALGLCSGQKASPRARGEGRGRATKSSVLGRSGAQRLRGVGGNRRLGLGSRGTSGLGSFRGRNTPGRHWRQRTEQRLKEDCMQDGEHEFGAIYRLSILSAVRR